MEFLLADDGSDDEDHKVEEELTTNKAIVAVKGIWTEDSDEDEDEGKQVGSSSQSAPSSSSLPKADDLFASVSSTFAPIAKAKTLATFSREIEITEPVKPAETKEMKVAVAAPPPPPVIEKRSNAAMTGKERDKDKETAKDRVKRQRMAGQSGIGSDFKTWKSEEEMRQRQQYD